MVSLTPSTRGVQHTNLGFSQRDAHGKPKTSVNILGLPWASLWEKPRFLRCLFPRLKSGVSEIIGSTT